MKHFVNLFLITLALLCVGCQGGCDNQGIHVGPSRDTIDRIARENASQELDEREAEEVRKQADWEARAPAWTLFCFGSLAVVLFIGGAFGVVGVKTARERGKRIYADKNKLWPVVEVDLGRGTKALCDPNRAPTAITVFRERDGEVEVKYITQPEIMGLIESTVTHAQQIQAISMVADKIDEPSKLVMLQSMFPRLEGPVEK